MTYLVEKASGGYLLREISFHPYRSFHTQNDLQLPTLESSNTCSQTSDDQHFETSVKQISNLTLQVKPFLMLYKHFFQMTLRFECNLEGQIKLNVLPCKQRKNNSDTNTYTKKGKTTCALHNSC
jgi:hypothetical protein